MPAPLPPLISGPFVPRAGALLTVQMPGETMRCPIERVIDADTVIVLIDAPPMTRQHFFRKGDKVGVRRVTINGTEVWEALSDRDFVAARSPSLPPVPKAKTKPKSPAKKKGTR